MIRRALFALLFLAALPVVASCRKEAAPGSAQAITIAVVPKGTTHEFWKSVHAGAVKASKELGVTVVWKGPLKEDDLKGQIDVVQNFVAQGVSGIVLAPLSDKGLVGSVKAAKGSKIPVVIFDSALGSDDIASFVATDNRVAGKLGGERLAKLLGGKGKVAMLRYQEASASTAEREKGFLDAMKGHPEITVVSDNQYGGATTESAFATSEGLLSAHQAASGGVDGVFCPNESTTFGMLRALRNGGLAGKIKLVGFDGSTKLVQGVREGHVHALVLQDPFNMGYLAVKTLAQHLKGERVEARIDTGAKLLDKGNVDAPEMKELYAPDLAKWLDQP